MWSGFHHSSQGWVLTVWLSGWWTDGRSNLSGSRTLYWAWKLRSTFCVFICLCVCLLCSWELRTFDVLAPKGIHRINLFYIWIFLVRWNSHNIKLTILRWINQWHFVHSQCCANTPLSSPKTFTSLISKTHYSLSNFSLPLEPLETTNLNSVSVDLSILDISYTWNHSAWDILCWASFV